MSALPTPAAPDRRPWYHRVGRFLRALLIFLVVVFHLFVLAIRNPLDLWDKEIKQWLQEQPAWGGLVAFAGEDREPAPLTVWEQPAWWDRASTLGDGVKALDKFTWKYTNLTGIEQRWVMFSPPMARKAYFFGVRIHFTDGTSHLLRSDNEPTDPTSYFRVGGWQTRKLEDYLLWPPDLTGDNNKSRSFWEANARDAIRRWKLLQPGDPRQIDRIAFVRRRIDMPPPGQTYADVDPPSESDLLTFEADGRLRP